MAEGSSLQDDELYLPRSERKSVHAISHNGGSGTLEKEFRGVREVLVSS